MAKVEAVIREQLISEKRISPRVQLVDTTAMEKHITYPTDSGLLHRGRAKLVKVIREIQFYGVATGRKVRSFRRLSKRAILQINKLGKGKKARIEENTMKLARYAWEMVKEVPHILEACKKHIQWRLGATVLRTHTRRIKRLTSFIHGQPEILKKVIYQAEERFKGHHVKDKIYSLHEPQVACNRKGKRSKSDEYGTKILLSVDRNGYVVTHREYSFNPNDSVLLEDAVQDWEVPVVYPTCGRVGADRGFHRPLYAYLSTGRKERT